MNRGICLIWILFLAVEGSLALGIFANCRHEVCEEYSLAPELRAINYMPPNEEQLISICPQALRFLECSNKELEQCTGYDIEGLATSANETIAKYGKVIFEISAFVTDVCNVNTTLHKNYIANVECFNGLIKAEDRSCMIEAELMTKTYSESKAAVEDDDGDSNEENSRCVEYAYSLACFSIQLQKNCGESARTTFLEIIKRLSMMSFDTCTEDEILSLKTEFLDYAKFDSEERNLFEAAFDAITY